MKNVKVTKADYSSSRDFSVMDLPLVYGDAIVRLNGHTYIVKYTLNDVEEYGLVQEPATHMEELLLYSSDFGCESCFSRKRFQDAFRIARKAIDELCEAEMHRRACAYDEFNESYDGGDYLSSFDEFCARLNESSLLPFGGECNA